MSSDTTTKRVFISYSWAVQQRVIELAERLVANGVDTVLDVWELKEGQDKYKFMEQMVNDPSIDRVLIICDKSYTDKANDRKGGVGDETVIISPELYRHTEQEKFIPVVFETDDDGRAYCPAYIKSRMYIDLSPGNAEYEESYEKLLRNIYEKPLYRKPALGTQPEWLENETVDLSKIRDIIKQVRGCPRENERKLDFLLRKAEEEFVSAAKQYRLRADEPIATELIRVIDQTKPYRDLFVDYCEALLYATPKFASATASLIERLDNELHDASDIGSCRSTDFAQFDYMIWELFICLTAICLYHEAFKELYEILTCTYLVRESLFSRNLTPVNYIHFRRYLDIIEDKCKPNSDFNRLITLAGHILVNREKKPILTKESLSNADIVLYQLSSLILKRIPNGFLWFPVACIYHEERQVLWQKMISRKYCERIMPLFGVTTLEALKEKIMASRIDRQYGYTGGFSCAPSIQCSIEVSQIGSMK